MIIDSHFHLENDLMPIDDIISSMDRNGIEKTALIASMCNGLAEPGETVLMLMRIMLMRKLTRRMIKTMLTRFTPDGNVKLPSGITFIESDPDNEKVFSAVDSHPDRFMAWVFVNPKGKKDPVSEFEKWKNHCGCVGVKTHPFWHRYKPIELLKVAEKASALGKPMLMHLGFDENGDILPLISKVPQLKLILAHAAFPSYQDMWKEIKPYPNIYVDLSATAYVDDRIMNNVIDFLGADRCIFGTDGPYGSRGNKGMFDHGMIRQRITKQFMDENKQRKILRDNFLTLTEK